LFLDWIASALAGRNARPVRILERFADTMGPAGGPSEILASRRRTSPFFAALVNGASSHIVEQDDLGDRRECLSLCLWDTQQHAKAALRLPRHQTAVSVVAQMYESYALERYILTKNVGSSKIELQRLGRRAALPSGVGIETVAAVLSWTIFGVGSQWSRGLRAQSADELATQVVSVLADGVAGLLAS
jgi:hypothetical protein